MKLRVGYELVYECPQSTPMMLMLNVHPSRRGDLETPDILRTDRSVAMHEYVDGFGNLCSRVLAPAGRTTRSECWWSMIRSCSARRRTRSSTQPPTSSCSARRH